MKKCSKCNTLKSLDSFYKNKNKKADPDGYARWCKDCMKKYCANWYSENREKLDVKNKEWRKQNPDKIRMIEKRYKEKDPIKWRNIFRKWEFRTYHNNLKYRLNQILSSNIRRSLKHNKNGRKWEKLIGYTCEELMKHLEKQFTNGMSWNNYGQWHIDHKIPISVFNFNKPEHIDFQRCWALSNLQPLWAKDNNEKRAKLNRSFQPSFIF